MSNIESFAPYQRLSDKLYEGTEDTADTEQRNKTILLVMITAEYLIAAVLLVSVSFGGVGAELAFPVQIIFVAVAMVIEYIMYKRTGEVFENAIVQSMFGISLTCLRVSKWFFLWVAYAPNYAHVISTAVTTGLSWSMWRDPNSAANVSKYVRNWAVVSVVGSLIGHLGIPGALTFFVILSMLLHLGCAFTASLFGDGLIALPEIADAANMQFLGKAKMHSRKRISETISNSLGFW